MRYAPAAMQAISAALLSLCLTLAPAGGEYLASEDTSASLVAVNASLRPAERCAKLLCQKDDEQGCDAIFQEGYEHCQWQDVSNRTAQPRWSHSLGVGLQQLKEVPVQKVAGRGQCKGKSFYTSPPYALASRDEIGPTGTVSAELHYAWARTAWQKCLAMDVSTRFVSVKSDASFTCFDNPVCYTDNDATADSWQLVFLARHGAGDCDAMHAASGSSSELAGSSGADVPVGSAAYMEFVARAWELCEQKSLGQSVFTTVFTDGSYRCYTASTCNLNDATTSTPTSSAKALTWTKSTCPRPFGSTGCVANGGDCTHMYNEKWQVCFQCMEYLDTKVTQEHTESNAVQGTWCSQEVSSWPEQVLAGTAETRSFVRFGTHSTIAHVGGNKVRLDPSWLRSKTGDNFVAITPMGSCEDKATLHFQGHFGMEESIPEGASNGVRFAIKQNSMYLGNWDLDGTPGAAMQFDVVVNAAMALIIEVNDRGDPGSDWFYVDAVFACQDENNAPKFVCYADVCSIDSKTTRTEADECARQDVVEQCQKETGAELCYDKAFDHGGNPFVSTCLHVSLLGLCITNPVMASRYCPYSCGLCQQSSATAGDRLKAQVCNTILEGTASGAPWPDTCKLLSPYCRHGIPSVRKLVTSACPDECGICANTGLWGTAASVSLLS
eukprot:gb/GFBE01000006.1/.p1 GENE.gb/GFBE01000006.1/~~gb/GFBE01000006.1/.p1  ORF type:complete len:666 (+),score=94.73 gb/GFBE01000006.1/:1-1998(+)